MGMFDDVECDYPLPDPVAQAVGFQTKSLGCMGGHYTITFGGQLQEDAYRDGTHVPVRIWPFHGDVVMCGSLPSRALIECLVRFTHGRVEFVRLLEPVTVPSVELLERELELDDQLLSPDVGAPIPGRHGRRPAEEFAEHAPAELEVVDGWITGAESLLRLTLVNVGLRRAALIVGKDAWRKALDGESSGAGRDEGSHSRERHGSG
jgi:hypothetical protein